MRQVREAALSRLTAPDFLPLSHHELLKLRQAPAWVRWLYVELLCCTELKTGKGKTSWARIMAVLDFDQAPTGRQRAGRVSLDQARRAVDELQAMGLVARDKGRNEAQGFLFFHVRPRKGFGAPELQSARGSARGSTGRSASNGAGSKGPAPAVSPGVPPGGSGVTSTPLPPGKRTLSTGAPARPVAAIVADLKAMADSGRGGTRPPKGGRK